ncbi:D-alanine--D-alanine ligase [Oleidesulfovibrio sp.]|uniref:D-alanine--D-alanine ligase n=1 Tax=Oleidesulfovibrio sp. TaxID=2909707 RepID=UPI003A8AA526
MRIAVVHNAVVHDAKGHDAKYLTGRPDQEDTLAQAIAVREALLARGHEAELMAVDLDLKAAGVRLSAFAPDVVFNLVEELENNIRMAPLAPALYAHLGIPFTGADAQSMTLSGDKLLCKQILNTAGLHTPAWIKEDGTCGGMSELFHEHDAFVPGRYLCKSVHEHASLGIDDSCLVDAAAAADVTTTLARCRSNHGGQWFAERYVDGREFNIAAVTDGQDGVRILPFAEIEFTGFAADRPKIVGYAAKWHDNTFEYHNTVRRFDFPEADSPMLDMLSEATAACWKAFGLAGYARVDFRVAGDGSAQSPFRPFIIDVNSNPCIAPDAGLAAAALRAGVSFEALVDMIVRDACNNGTAYAGNNHA